MIALTDSHPAGVSNLPDYISPSAAKSYLACSLRFYFERVLEIRRATTPALHLGKAIHSALQAFHLARWRGTDDSPETVAAAFEEAFLKLEQDSPELPKDKPRGVEVPLHEFIPGLQVALTGVIDLLTGIFAPIDFKSAAAKPDPRHAIFDHEIQLVSYQLLLERAIGERPPSLDLVFLVKTKVPKVIRLTSPPADMKRKDRVIRLLDTAVTGMSEGRFHPQPGMTCMSCQYQNECKVWPESMERRHK